MIGYCGRCVKKEININNSNRSSIHIDGSSQNGEGTHFNRKRIQKGEV